VATQWSLADLARASLALDVYDEAERRAQAQARHEANMRDLSRKMK